MFGHTLRTQKFLLITGFALFAVPAAHANDADQGLFIDPQPMNIATLDTGVADTGASGPGAQPYYTDPALITSDQLPKNIKQGVYSKPARVREITSSEVMGRSYYDAQNTVVGEKVKQLENQLSQLQSGVSSLITDVNNVQKMNEGKAAQYYADVATISTQLQSGTTPGNPRLVKRLTQAEANLEQLGGSVATLNNLAAEASNRASESAYLLEATRAAYSLSGAIEEDHVRLAELEDAVNSTSVIIERLLNNVNDDITRTATYLNSERNNLRSLSVGVNNGDLYGKSLGNRPFSSAGVFQASATSDMSMGAPGGMGATPAVSNGMSPGMRPLVKIRFDKPEVNYEQPVYMAVNEALQRYPNARFELVAVHPTAGNAAQVAIESTRARRNAEKVLRTLTQMGLDLERVNLSYTQSPEAQTNEVHLYIR
jgi:hypothetical protein